MKKYELILNSEKFFDLMQCYRIANVTNQDNVLLHYNNVISFIKDEIIKPINEENEELKARCDTYKKEYESLVSEVVRLSGENSKMKELIADRIKELES
jgi:hypothetical protein